MAKLEGADRVVAALRRRVRAVSSQGKGAVVGYTAPHALKVHEDMEVFHPNGRAKYLEGPARELANSGKLARVILAAVKRGVPLPEAELLAAQLILRESQTVVPVDTGELKASGFAKVEA